jgi:hypothetical protein
MYDHRQNRQEATPLYRSLLLIAEERGSTLPDEGETNTLRRSSQYDAVLIFLQFLSYGAGASSLLFAVLYIIDLVVRMYGS